MSGNNYDDILDTLNTADRQTVKKLIHLMANYRPQVEINRVFQRNLKKELLLKASRKTLAWHIDFSYLSILATSFVLLFGIWKMWGIDMFQTEKGWNSHSNIAKNTLGTTELSGISGEEKFSNQGIANEGMRSLASEKIALSDTSQLQDSSLIRESNTTPSASTKQVAPTDVREINLSNEIANISNDIDAIVDSSLTPPTNTPNAGMSNAKMSTLAAVAPPVEQGVIITIDYPTRMVVYKKSGIWTSSEQASRTGSGVSKNLEKTISKGELSTILANKGELMEMTLEYKTAKKPGENLSYLIPCLRYKITDGTYDFSPLIRGYTLD